MLSALHVVFYHTFVTLHITHNLIQSTRRTPDHFALHAPNMWPLYQRRPAMLSALCHWPNIVVPDNAQAFGKTPTQPPSLTHTLFVWHNCHAKTFQRQPIFETVSPSRAIRRRMLETSRNPCTSKKSMHFCALEHF